MPTPASQVELTLFEDQLGELILLDAPGAQISALSDQTPLPIGTESAGTASAASRADHIHRHGNQTGGSLHLGATSGAAGFMSSADKTKLDAATDADTASTLVLRDSVGDFAANEITADLIGNVTGDLTGVASDIADNTVTSAKIVDGAIVDADVNASASIAVSKLADGAARQLLQTDAAGTGVEWASNIDVPGTLDVTGAATFDAAVTIQGDLTVNGTETIINTQTLDVEDKNIVIGKVNTPTDVTADGGGITLKGATDKTINWVDATDAWTFSEHVDLANAKEYRIAGTKVLDATSLGSVVVSSSLTSVGTLTAGTLGAGFTTVAPAQGGTGQTTYANGELLIGKTDGTLAKATLTAGTGVAITNADGSVTVAVDSTVVTTAQTGTVTSTMIADGTIVDADVNASAAIAGTKVAPNFGSQTITTTGVINPALGTAALPSVAFTGDPNTGLYSPGSDQLAVTVGGADAAKFTSTGLEIEGDLNLDDGGSFTTTLQTVTPTQDNTISFPNATGTVGLVAGSTSQIILNRDGSYAGLSTLTADTSGNVTLTGRFVSSLNGALSTTGIAGVPAALTGTWIATGGTATTTKPQLLLEPAGTTSTAWSTAGTGLGINAASGFTGQLFDAQVNGTSRMVVTGAGRLGLGSSSPAVKFELRGISDGTSADAVFRLYDQYNGAFTAQTDNCAIEFFSADSNGPGAMVRSKIANTVEDTSGAAQALTFSTTTNTSGQALTERLRIRHNGNVGIGTNSPNESLEVAGNIHVSGADRSIFNRSNNALTFGTNNTERARIDSSGRLLVGTSSAITDAFGAVNRSLQVVGSVSSMGTHRNDNTAFSSAFIFTKARGTGFEAVSNNDSLGIISWQGANGSAFNFAAEIKAEVDGTVTGGGTADMPGRLMFSTTADGAAAPTERLRITSAGVLQVADAGNITVGTTTGTKIGTATTQKLGFYNATPVAQPAAVADITTTATAGSLPTPDGSVTIADATTPTVTELLEYCVEIEAKLEAALGRLRTLGLIAT
jgi:hypothetical protein